MIEYTEVQTIEQVATTITCDRCNKRYGVDDVLETQEFHRIRFTGGYGSVFGDETNVTCDLCQYCLKELIGEFCYYDGERQHKVCTEIKSGL